MLFRLLFLFILVLKVISYNPIFISGLKTALNKKLAAIFVSTSMIGCFHHSTLSQNEILQVLPLLSFNLGQKDCFTDCNSNCNRVAPGAGSKEYCKSSCEDYCLQTDRNDGLSGSVSDKGGETGLFGGSIDGTVTYSDDKPPQGINIIPQKMLKDSTKKFKKSG